MKKNSQHAFPPLAPPPIPPRGLDEPKAPPPKPRSPPPKPPPLPCCWAFFALRQPSHRTGWFSQPFDLKNSWSATEKVKASLQSLHDNGISTAIRRRGRRRRVRRKKKRSRVKGEVKRVSGAQLFCGSRIFFTGINEKFFKFYEKTNLQILQKTQPYYQIRFEIRLG